MINRDLPTEFRAAPKLRRDEGHDHLAMSPTNAVLWMPDIAIHDLIQLFRVKGIEKLFFKKTVYVYTNQVQYFPMRPCQMVSKHKIR